MNNNIKTNANIDTNININIDKTINSNVTQQPHNTKAPNNNNDVKIIEEIDFDNNNEITNNSQLQNNTTTSHKEEILSLTKVGSTGIVNDGDLDFTKIAQTESEARRGEFLQPNNVSRDFYSGNLSFELLDKEGTVMLYNDETPIGFSTLEGVAGND